MANVRIKNKIPKESEIQAVICEYLFDLKHYFGWRQNTTPIWSGKDQQFRSMPKYSKRGVPDIILVGKKGFIVFLEVKRPGAKLSEYQEDFKRECEKVGAVYLKVCSLDDVVAAGL